MSCAALLTSLLLGACHTYRLPYGPNSEALSPVADEQVRVTDLRGMRVELAHARIERDSVVGQSADSALRRFAISLADVSTIEIRRPNADANAMLIAAGVVVGVVLVVGAALHLTWMPF